MDKRTVSSPHGSLIPFLRKYADRTTGYIYQDEIETLRAAADRIESLESALCQIADPSYVGNYGDAQVIGIYRRWAQNALGGQT